MLDASPELVPAASVCARLVKHGGEVLYKEL